MKITTLITFIFLTILFYVWFYFESEYNLILSIVIIVGLLYHLQGYGDYEVVNYPIEEKEDDKVVNYPIKEKIVYKDKIIEVPVEVIKEVEIEKVVYIEDEKLKEENAKLIEQIEQWKKYSKEKDEDFVNSWF